MGKVLGIVYRAISTHLIHKAGYRLKDGATSAVILIQRFGSALKLNIHFHILFLDGAYIYRDNRPHRFQRVKAPAESELELEPADDTDAILICAVKKGIYRSGRSWCHPPGHHQIRCLFSRERTPRYRRSISPDAAEHSVGTDSCGLQPGNDHKRFASGRMRDRFQHVRCQSPDSIHEKHRDTGRKISHIDLLSVLYSLKITLAQRGKIIADIANLGNDWRGDFQRAFTESFSIQFTREYYEEIRNTIPEDIKAIGDAVFASMPPVSCANPYSPAIL